jgi:hypothetical protein
MTVPRSPLVLATTSAVLLLFVTATVLPTTVTLAAPQPLAQADPSPTPSSGGGSSLPSIPNPFAGLAEMLSPDNLGKLIRDTLIVLLQQAVSGLHDLLLTLTQGDGNVITHTPPGMTYQQPSVLQRHDALLNVVDWGLAAAVAIMGLLVILGPNSPLSFPAAGEIGPRVVIAFIAAHTSLQWGRWFIDLNNALCTAVTPSDPFPLLASNDLGTAFALLGVALLYGFMAVFLSLFMFVRVQLIAVLLILAPLAAVLWVLPGRPRQWGELWMDLFFSNLFVQFLQVLALNFGVGLLQTAGGDSAGFLQFLGGAATLLLVFRIPALTAAGVGGGATSFLGLVSLFRGLQSLGVPRASLAAQQSLSRAPGAALNAARHPVTTVTQEWREIANSPAGQAVSAARRAASSVGARVRDAAVVRRGI